ncbi:hypothetical protein D9758_012217 [Tetrapyrgos nigripes]|uniref:Uncharacterized protein n=1 Tax=Tetrapyrgos nigripes TaxID=182062 RepID=A0A8H5FIH7_9AGAR|nr:hypothetical protein D9758_012217 [Tetrapyrgos nigripes]
MYRLDNPSLASITSEELHWLTLHATILQDESPVPESSKSTPASQSPSYQRSTKSSSAKFVPKRPSLPTPPNFPSQEWIYRSPRSPSTPSRKRPLPPTPSSCGPLPDSQPSSSCSSPTKFWTSPSRSDSRSYDDHSIPSLWFGAVDCHTSPKSKRSASDSGLSGSVRSSTSRRPTKPRSRPMRSGSISSVSSSTSAMSSPPHTPTTTPTRLPSFKKFEPHHRCILECDEDGDQPLMRGSPTKGILSPPRMYSRSSSSSGSARTSTRSGRKSSTTTTSSMTTDSSLNSSLSSNKSVKFADTPTIHYSSGLRFSYGDYASYECGTKNELGELGYGEDWGGDPFRNYMGGDDGEGKHLKHPYARVTGVLDEEDEETDDSDDVDGIVTEDEEDVDDGTQFREFLAQSQARESLCKTPTPDSLRNIQQNPSQSPSSLRKLVSLKRKPSTTSSRTTRTTDPTSGRPSTRPKARSTTSEKKPMISGPYVLGSLSHGASNPANLPGVRSAPVLRATPSEESFKSGKSAGVKSVKSVRSLKSLPESIKSSISLRAKGMKDWLRGRVSIGA